jgi:branched-chain amino acid transport system substrate-binding protein
MKHLLVVQTVFVFVAALVLSAWTTVARADEPYRFNIILSLSGSATFLGKQEQGSFEIEEKMLNKSGGINGRPVKFVYYDDQSK